MMSTMDTLMSGISGAWAAIETDKFVVDGHQVDCRSSSTTIRG